MRIASDLFARRKPRTPRRYISKSIGVEGFFERLNANNVSYACLRWHEHLPEVKAGEDIDMLVADESLDFVESVLTGTKRSGIPVDLYTVGGLPTTNYCTVAYFVPELASAALRTPTSYKEKFKIPDPVSYFYTMCYHVVYHKGLRSGLPESLGGAFAGGADHDYASAIARLAKEAGLPVPEMSLTHLESVLFEAGWRPPTDTLRKYSKRNEWLRSVIADRSRIDDSDLDGLAVFIVRERANVLAAEIGELLRSHGLEPIAIETISDGSVDRVASRLRGGNWNRGPWPLSGGKPATVIVAYDCFPKMVASPENPLEQCNAAVQSVKERVRRELRRRHPETAKYNAIHSSDCPKDALEYMEIIDPELGTRCRQTAKEIAETSRHPFNVLARLDSFGRRAKVERIAYGAGTAICKTFRPGAERFLQRELRARAMFQNFDLIVPALASGSNYLLMPDVAGGSRPPRSLRPFGSRDALLPVSALMACRNLISKFRKEGYELIDFAPQNLILDEKGEPRFIDFEFLQKGPVATESLVGNYAWRPPADFSGDYPFTVRKRDPYAMRWFGRTGVPRAIYVRVQHPGTLRVFQLGGMAFISARNALNSLGRVPKKMFRKR